LQYIGSNKFDMKNIIKKLSDIYTKQLFFVNALSIFINPAYFSRKGLLRNLKKDAPLMTGKLMDFGSGRKPYQSLFTHVSEYIGVDIETSGHNHASSKIDVFYDGKTLPFENESFDSIFTSETLEHVFNPNTILAELNRCLKPDGKLLITIPFAGNEHEIPYDYGRYTSFGIAYLLKKHGFEVLHIQKTTSFFETICQFFNTFWIENVFPKYRPLRILLQAILLGPLNIIFILLNYILPDNQTMPLNLVVMAKK